MRPIPKSLLIHTVMHMKSKDKDRWGKERFEEEQKLRFVRLEPTSKIIRDKNGAEIQLAATLFFDCKNSRPNDMVFAEDDIILFNGQKFKVQVIELLYDERKPHHYELGLIKSA